MSTYSSEQEAKSAGVGAEVPSAVTFILSFLEQISTFFLGFFQDPMTSIIKLLVFIFLCLVVYVVVWHHDRVLYLLTGDSNVHMDFCTMISVGTRFFLETCAPCLCCGTGECTRRFTSNQLCKNMCPDFYRQNMLLACGRIIGSEAYPIKVKNIMVGDLPGVGRQDYYVCFECKTDPEMNSSVAEHHLPKVVSFNETIIVRIRNSILESPLRITVRRLTRPVGHEEVCEVYFQAEDILRWAGVFESSCCCCSPSATSCNVSPEDEQDENPPGSVLRFKMQVLTRVPYTTSPWISLKFMKHGVEDWEHTMDTLPDDFLGAYCCCDTSTVVAEVDAGEVSSRAALFGEEGLIDSRGNVRGVAENTSEAQEESGTSFLTWPWQLFSNKTRMHQNRMYEQIPLSDFKQQHPLREPTGIYVDGELPEGHLRSLNVMNTACFLCNSFLRIMFVIVFFSYCVFRSYVKSCWQYFTRVTPVILYKEKGLVNVSFPIDEAVLDAADYMCQKQLRKRMASGQVIPPGRVCNPTVGQVMEVCDDRTLDFHSRAWQSDSLGRLHFPRQALPICWRGSSSVSSVCHWHAWMGKFSFDTWATIFFVVLLVLSCGNHLSSYFLMQRCKKWAWSHYLKRQNKVHGRPTRDSRDSQAQRA